MLRSPQACGRCDALLIDPMRKTTGAGAEGHPRPEGGRRLSRGGDEGRGARGLGPRSARTNGVAERVQRLVARDIDSVGELELLLLAWSTVGRAWTGEQASRELRTSLVSASARLEDLRRKGLLERGPDGYAYSLAGERDAAVAELASAYATHRTRIVELIYG